MIPTIAVVILAIIAGRALLKAVDELLIEKIRKDSKRYLIRTILVYGFWFASISGLLYLVFGKALFSATTAGLVSAVLVYVLQKPILNFFGWMYILSFRPFLVGDRISVGELIGDVYSIDMMATRIKVVDGFEPTGKMATIPNEKFLTSEVMNMSFPTKYVWDKITFSFTYESNIKKAEAVLLSSAPRLSKEEMERIAGRKYLYMRKEKKMIPFVRIRLNDSSIDLSLSYLVNYEEAGKLRKETIEKVIKEVSKDDELDFAYPHLVVLKKDQANVSTKDSSS